MTLGCLSGLALLILMDSKLALNSETQHHGYFSGILCPGIFGAALVPLIIGWHGDLMGLRLAMLFKFVTFGYILSVAFWARPIINNKTVSLRELIRIKKQNT